MRIAIVHSFYSSDVPSGENAMVHEQVEALVEAGHDVLLVARRTDEDSRQFQYALRSAGRVISGRGPDPTVELRTFAPDIVHVHNLFPNFGTRWLRSWGGPIVATLHNFRPLCANGLLFRDGEICEKCPTGSPWSAIRHGCYHGSRLASIPLAVRNASGAASDDVLSRADALVCLSAQSASHYRRLTALELPVYVIPNGMDVPPPAAAPPNGRWLVVSRLTPEKGVRELAAAWPAGEQLDIAGAGPESEAIRDLGRTGVTLLGNRDRTDLLAAMPAYEGLVFPSRCREMQPTVLTEAIANGLPIVALSGSAGESVARVAGAEYSDGNSLKRALGDVRRDRPRLSARVRALYESDFTRERWIRSLTDLYSQVTNGGSSS